MAKPPRVIPRRSSGALLPVFSLPSSLDQGDFGPNVIPFLDWLQRAKQRYWMILPLNPVDSTGSPYASSSAFAINPLLISPERLVHRRLLTDADIAPLRRRGITRDSAARRRFAVLWLAYERWRQVAPGAERRRFAAYVSANRSWLEPWAMFSALKHQFGRVPWWKWPSGYETMTLAKRRIDDKARSRMDFERFMQWLATEQWAMVMSAARQRGIQIIGDVPFTVRQDSADVWAHPELFHVSGRQLTLVSGMPPDAFSKNGQRWGTPLFNWPAHRRQKFDWWTERLRVKLERVDLLRLDHFQGFVREWAIPTRAKDARHGQWLPSPGVDLFTHLRRRLGQLPFIAEDLGLQLPAADQLRISNGLLGTRIFLFGWSGMPRNIHALHHITPDMMYMTSNHDLPTVSDWWRRSAKWYERQHLRPKLNGRSISSAALQIAAATPAQLVMVPMADALGLGAAARINRPGTRRGNWRWRLTPSQLDPRQATRWATITRLAKRG